MGNICRSPLAASVLMAELERRGWSQRMAVDSAGTYAGHQGEKPDPRAVAIAMSRGYGQIQKQRSRPVVAADFERFDLILAMDRDNLGQLEAGCPPHLLHKLQLFLPFARWPEETEVPDPYYGNAAGFERVMNLCEAGARGVLDRLGEDLG